MPRCNDPINDFFNELLDATLQTVVDTIRPEFRKIAKDAVVAARAKANAKAKQPTSRKLRSEMVRTPQLTLYDVLEVSPRASQETIEAAYKSLARKHHPDVGGSVSLMQDITNAYSVLKDKVSRQKYNRSIGLNG